MSSPTLAMPPEPKIPVGMTDVQYVLNEQKSLQDLLRLTHLYNDKPHKYGVLGPYSPNQGLRSGAINVDSIVLHTTGVPKKGLAGPLSHFFKPKSVSAHLITGHQNDAGRLCPWVQVVQFDRAAWHAGTVDANLRSVGIETCGNSEDPVIENQYVTTACLVVMVRSIYANKLNLKIHRQVVATRCPTGWSHNTFLDTLAQIESTTINLPYD